MNDIAKIISSQKYSDNTVSSSQLKSCGLTDLKLRDYQLFGVNWLLQRQAAGHGCILSDEMGLGKTCQTVSFLVGLTAKCKSSKFLIVSPLSVLHNWKDEISRFSPSFKLVSYIGDKEKRSLLRDECCRMSFNILLTTYEMCIKDKEFINKFTWDALIVDEGHRLKNNESLLYQILNEFQIKHRVLLTGTPVQNNLNELYNLLHFVAPHIFKLKFTDKFVSKFSVLKNSTKESKEQKQLVKMIEPFILRRVKEEVLEDLPKKSQVLLYHDITELQKKYYKALLMKDSEVFETTSYGGSKTRLMNILMQLRKCVNHPYLFDGVEPEPFQMGEHLVEASGKLLIIDKLLSHLKKCGHKVLLFSQMTRMLDILQDYLTYRGFTYERLDGNVRSEERFLAVKNFNSTDDTFVFLLSTRAGGVGLNLVAADTVVFVDSDFNPQNDVQAAARAHRIGQNRPVKIIRLVSRNTVEEIILRRAEAKLQLTRNVVDVNVGEKDKTELFSDAEVKIQDILKFGVHALLDENAAPSKDANVDFEKILGRSENASWVPDEVVEAEEEKGATASAPQRTEAESVHHMYMFEGQDYSKTPSADDQRAVQQLVDLQKKLELESQTPASGARPRRLSGSGVDWSSSGLPPSIATPRRKLTPAQLEERRRKREETKARKLAEELEKQKKLEEKRKKKREELWRANHYESLCVALGDPDDDSEESESEPEGEGDGEEESSKKLALRYVIGDVTQPPDRYADCRNAIICHCLDNGGSWGSGGIFSALLRRSTQPKTAYEEAGRMRDLHLGDVHLVPCDDLQSRGGEARDFAALLVAQEVRAARQLRLPALESCLRRLRRLARQQKASLHLPRIGHSTPNFNWYGVERLLRKHLSGKGIPTFIYYYPRKKSRPLCPSANGDDDDVIRKKGRASKADDDSDDAAAAGPSTSSSGSQQCVNLESIFTDKVLLFRGVEQTEASNLRRYVIAYDGDVVTAVSSDVTHVVVGDDESTSADVSSLQLPDNVWVVKVDWINDCLSAAKCLDEVDYTLD